MKSPVEDIEVLEDTEPTSTSGGRIMMVKLTLCCHPQILTSANYAIKSGCY